ncbi:MAG TPA: alpha/beta hydrolase [Thermomicrobiaceae bacterium]|nr:alpha/beta hydrolase [Thermomicrobiaceae bacterium]
MAGSWDLDPQLFRTEAIDPVTAAFNEQLAQLLATVPSIVGQDAQKVRDARREGGSTFPPPLYSERAQTRSIPGPGGAVPLRLFVPDTVRGVYLHIHGGGWTLGTADSQDTMLDQLADAASVAVVSVEYRLSPEHPYPAGPDDCEVAALWLAEHAASEFGADRLVIGGESAGGHLSVVTLVRLRDRHGYTGCRGADLVYGAYDLSGTPSVRGWQTPNLVLDRSNIEWFTDNFVPDATRRREPDVSPLYADLRGLPPALFTIGTLDPLIDDNLFMYARWVAAGNEANLAVYPGGVHGFTLFPTPIGQRALERSAAFVAAAVS